MQWLRELLVWLGQLWLAWQAGQQHADAAAVADERDAVVRQQSREADLDRLARPELLERMRDTDSRVRAVQARIARRR